MKSYSLADECEMELSYLSFTESLLPLSVFVVGFN